MLRREIFLTIFASLTISPVFSQEKNCEAIPCDEIPAAIMDLQYALEGEKQADQIQAKLNLNSRPGDSSRSTGLKNALAEYRQALVGRCQSKILPYQKDECQSLKARILAMRDLPDRLVDRRIEIVSIDRLKLSALNKEINTLERTFKSQCPLKYMAWNFFKEHTDWQLYLENGKLPAIDDQTQNCCSYNWHIKNPSLFRYNTEQVLKDNQTKYQQASCEKIVSITPCADDAPCLEADIACQNEFKATFCAG